MSRANYYAISVFVSYEIECVSILYPFHFSFFFLSAVPAVTVPFLILLQLCVTFDYYQCNDCALCLANNLMMMLFVVLMLSGGCVQCDQIALCVCTCAMMQNRIV